MSKILTAEEVGSVEVFDVCMPEGSEHAFFANDILVHNCDLDFSDKEKIIEVLKKEYGERFLPISIDMKLKPRSAIKDAERALFGSVRKETEIMTKMMPQVPQGAEETEWLLGYQNEDGEHVSGYFDQSPELQKYARNNPEVWDLVLQMCGVQRQKGQHACISFDELCDTSDGISLFGNAKDLCGKPISSWSSGVRDTVRLMLNNGVILNCTPDHKIMINGEEIEAQSCLNKTISFKSFVNYYGAESVDERLLVLLGWSLRDEHSFRSGNPCFHINSEKDENLLKILDEVSVDYSFEYRLDKSMPGKVFLEGRIPEILNHEHERLPYFFWDLDKRSQKMLISSFLSAVGVFSKNKSGKRCLQFKTSHWRLASDLAHWFAAENVRVDFGYSPAFEPSPGESRSARSEIFSYEIELDCNLDWFNDFFLMQDHKQENLNKFLSKIDQNAQKVHKSSEIVVSRIEKGEQQEVFDFNEPSENVGYVSGMLVHNCGIVILPKTASEYFPVYRVGGKRGELVTAFSPKGLEYVGGIKIDILGVKKMHSLQKCMNLIEKRHGRKLEWGEFDHDIEVYKSIYWSGDTEGTFQTNTSGITELGRKTKPESVIDIANNISLFRPSCLDASPTWDPDFQGNLVDYYVASRNGSVRPKFIHEDLIPIVGTTAGSFVFQEQVLKTFRDIGGMTYEEAESVRRSIGKKDVKTLATEGERLKKQCLKRGWTEEQAENLFETIMASSRYGFNMAHGVSYAIVSYDCAYLKHHYSLEFWASELSCEFDNEDKLRKYSELLGDMILQPDILKSHPTDFIIEGDKLRAPLSLLKGVGIAVVEDIQKILSFDIDTMGLLKKA